MAKQIQGLLAGSEQAGDAGAEPGRTESPMHHLLKEAKPASVVPASPRNHPAVTLSPTYGTWS